MNPAQPIVSIIIPTYNRAHLIGETLDSVLAQTYTHWECIVVDDGSNDMTDAVLKAYCQNDSRFSYYNRPLHIKKGPSACRNFGYEKSNGAFIQWFDSDDKMHPEKLQLKIEAAQKYQADVIIDNHSESYPFKEIQDFDSTHFTSKDFYISFLLGKKPVITNDVMLKKSIINHQRFDEYLWKGEEFEFYSRVFQQELTYCFLEVSLTHYSISEDSISLSKDQSESLIYLSKKLINAHANNEAIVAKSERQGRKTYKSLAKNKNLKMIFKHFHFFQKVHHKPSIIFILFIIYNFLTGKGFDKIKP